MNRQALIQNIKNKKSFLCIGLDSDINKIPKHLFDHEDPVFEFNKQIIDSTIEFAVAYKPNTAFYESRGAKGWESLEKTFNYLKQFKDDVFTIADAKRGDIGNTSNHHALALFENLDADAATIAPYMGEDSVTPFLTYKDKWVIILALTSNKSASDFQQLHPRTPTFFKMLGIKKYMSESLYETVIKKSMKWGSHNNMMYVVGATKAEKLVGIRKIIPYHFLLIPGVGSQGGSLHKVAHYGLNKQCGLLVNSSRGIIFSSAEKDFAEKAQKSAKSIQHQMKDILKNRKII